MKKIIVPVDFSTYSENALKTAAYIAKKQHAAILAVHMLELSNAIIIQSESHSQEEAAFYFKLTEKKFYDFLDKDYLEGIVVTPIIKHYKIFNELNQLAKEEKADLIVMGSKGTTGLKELFVGSNTEKVVRNSSVPVLVVKEVPVLSDFDKAVFACDFSKDDIKPYQKAKKILDALGCELQLLHVNTPYGKFKTTRQQQEKISKFLMESDGNRNGLNDVAYVSDFTVEEGILEYANLNGIDLIVMATHGRRGLSHFLEGSISEDVTNHSTLPVMTFRI